MKLGTRWSCQKLTKTSEYELRDRRHQPAHIFWQAKIFIRFWLDYFGQQKELRMQEENLLSPLIQFRSYDKPNKNFPIPTACLNPIHS